MESEHESIAPWTKEDDPESDTCLVVKSAESGNISHLWAQRALLNLCSPLMKSMDVEEETIPIIGFEPQQVAQFLSVVHPGIFLKTTTGLILEVAPVAHYLECSSMIVYFVSWLQEESVFDDDADDRMDADLLAAIVLLERLRPRTPGECPWGDDVLYQILQQHVPNGAVASILERTDTWVGIKAETQLKLLLVLNSSLLISPVIPYFPLLTQWIQEAGLRMIKPVSLHRTSKDGWAAADFHRLCDGKPNAVTVIKTTEGFIFGGFLDQPWHSDSSRGITSPKAFLFALRVAAETPLQKPPLEDPYGQ